LKRALQSFGVVTGYQEVPVVGRTLLKGYGQMPVLGYNPQSSLNGYTTAAVPMNGPSVSSRIMGAIPGTGKGSGISNGSELMG
jgi:hypothetical protein